MQKEAAERRKEFSNMANNKVLKDVEEYDEFGNKKIVRKLVDDIGPKKVPKSNNLKSCNITVTDANGNKIQKAVLVDDQGKIIDEDDVEYVNETIIDEFGNKITRQVPKIKDESLRRMQKEAAERQKEFSNMANNKVLKDVEEYDEFGNKKIVRKLVDDIGPKKAPKSNNLKSCNITVTDANGNEIQKAVLVDDQGNIIDEDDVEYIEFDEFGNRYANKITKIKDE